MALPTNTDIRLEELLEAVQSIDAETVSIERLVDLTFGFEEIVETSLPFDISKRSDAINFVHYNIDPRNNFPRSNALAALENAILAEQTYGKKLAEKF